MSRVFYSICDGKMTVIARLAVFLLAASMAALGDEPAVYGEPYEMEGNRLVFTNWHFVRAGGVGWMDPETKKPVYATHDAKYAPEVCTWNPSPHNPWGIEIRAYAPSEIRRAEIPPEKPWESKPITLDCIVEEDGIYKGWGSCGAPCYLESEDGIHWRRPSLGLVAFEGSKENNLVPHLPKRHVFIDPTSEDERYKCVWEAHVSQEAFEAYCAARPGEWSTQARRYADGEPFYVCLKGAVSKDGYVWHEIERPLVMAHTDTLNIGYYDERLGKYVIYVRTWNTFRRAPAHTEERSDNWLEHGRRCIGRIEGDDFRNLPLPETILEAGPAMHPTAGLYTNCFTWAPGAPECLLMFPAVYYNNNDTLDIWIASSIDGKAWNWIPGNPLMETAGFGHWDGGCIFTNPPLMELGDGHFALPYFGSNVPHKYPRGLMEHGWGYALWPHGRLAALVAEERGAFSTVSLVPPGTKLYLNARTKRAGHIRVAAYDGRRGWPLLEGRALEDCVPIVGDHPRVQVRWNDADDLGIAPGAPVMLRFEMQQAELFAMTFE